MILIVDADVARQNQMADILREAGYGVLTAESAKEAEALYDASPAVDLVIARVILKEESGVHVTTHVQQSGRETKTLLTSHFSRDLLRNVPGFTEHYEFLPNPFSENELLSRVRRLLSGRH